MRSCRVHLPSIGAVTSVLLIVGMAVGQAETPPASGKTPAAEPPPQRPRSDEPKSLDDLLGVPNDPAIGDRSAEDAAEREQRRRLERSLDEASIDDLVLRAIEGMKSASSGLSERKDAGLGTQRTQEDVLRTLDRLLEEAQRQQRKSRSSQSSSGRSKGSKDLSSTDSGSKDSSSQDPSERNGQQRPSRARPEGVQSGAQADGGTESTDAERAPIDGVSEDLSESRIEWGRLPERIRELVLQGRRDRVSTIYERLTREYYRRLAEEASR